MVAPEARAMKARLMHRDRDFDPAQPPSPGEAALVQDLELETLFAAMAQDDKIVLDAARRAILSGLGDVDAIAYRQDVLADCLNNRGVVRAIYALAVEANERERKSYFGMFVRYPGMVLRRSVEVLGMFVEILARLRKIADEDAAKFRSEGFTNLFAMLRRELDGDYFVAVRRHLAQLKFRGGVLISAELGNANKGAKYCLRRPHARRSGWLSALFSKQPPSYGFRLHPRDEAGARALSELADRGINLVANATAQSNDHILAFLRMMQTELGFYVGCLNLHERLAAKGEPFCFPRAVASDQRVHAFEGLYDVCLSLSMAKRVIGNDFDASGKHLVMITGPNQGGKSTFLRSIGLAQLMMQAGMFAPARSFAANLSRGVETHHKREEDASMTSGKLDEELARMSAIVDRLHPDGMALFNESFQSTNEREGSSIARSIVFALLDHRVKVFFVTHLHDLARSLYERGDTRMAFLRAERLEDGERSLRMVEGRPLSTSHGEDLYRHIFEEEARAAGPSGAAE
jgi:DNA mismatch repair ATPase MutS